MLITAPSLRSTPLIVKVGVALDRIVAVGGGRVLVAETVGVGMNVGLGSGVAVKRGVCVNSGASVLVGIAVTITVGFAPGALSPHALSDTSSPVANTTK